LDFAVDAEFYACGRFTSASKVLFWPELFVGEGCPHPAWWNLELLDELKGKILPFALS
jgi:hypothetical protein